MKRIFFVTVLVVLALASAMGMGVAGAQTQDNATENASDELETNGSVAALEHQETIEFNNNTRIVGWEFRGGQVTIVLESDRRTGVVVTDALAGIGDEGAVQVPETRQFLDRDEVTTVTMDVSEFQGGHSIAVTVDGMTVRLSTDMDEDNNPLQYFGGEQGLLFGMFMSILTSGGAAGFVLWHEESGVIQA